MNTSAICSVFTEDGITSKIQNIPAYTLFQSLRLQGILTPFYSGRVAPFRPAPGLFSRVSQRLPLTLCFFATLLSI